MIQRAQLPRPQEALPDDDFPATAEAAPAAAVREEDFPAGAVFPELHATRRPLGTGRQEGDGAQSRAQARTLDGEGKVRQVSGAREANSQLRSLMPKREAEEEEQRPLKEEEEEVDELMNLSKLELVRRIREMEQRITNLERLNAILIKDVPMAISNTLKSLITPPPPVVSGSQPTSSTPQPPDSKVVAGTMSYEEVMNYPVTNVAPQSRQVNENDMATSHDVTNMTLESRQVNESVMSDATNMAPESQVISQEWAEQPFHRSVIGYIK